LLTLYGEFLTSDYLQYGFKKGSGCAHAVFTFTESVKYFVKRDSKVHCAFLNASKAFDQVLLNGLFLKLLKRDVPLPFIRIMINWYSGLQCAVIWNNIVGDRFNIACGVRQSGVLSPYLFSIYIDDLITDLRQSGYGIYVDSLFAGCILYADDVVLLSGSFHGLQKMLDICSQYGVQFDIRFNPLKSQTSTFGGRHPSHIPLKLNGSVIPVTEKVK